MIALNSRVVIYASDYAEFTGSSPFALDGCDVDNNLGPSVTDEPSAIEWERALFESAAAKKAADKALQKFFLMSMATGVPGAQVLQPITGTFVDYRTCVFTVKYRWCTRRR